MRLLLMLLITNLIFTALSVSVTYKQNKILSRKKRFLTFPEGSNFVMTISGLKEILLKVPKGFRTVVECDVQFKLPNKSFRSYVKDLSMHTRHRREIFDEISKLFYMFDLNGDACIKRMICDGKYLQGFKDNSLFQQLLSTVFMNTLSVNSTEMDCNKSNSECDVSLLGIILNHIYK